MVKKTLLSLAIAASTAGLTACNISSTTDNNVVDDKPVKSGLSVADGGTAGTQVMPVFQPTERDALGIPQMPLITDLLFNGAPDADGSDGTIPFPAGNEGLIKDGAVNPAYNPIFSAFADMDGFSTAAAIDIPFTGAIDGASLVASKSATQNVFLIPLNYRNDPLTGGASKSTDTETPLLEAGASATLASVPFDFANLPSISASAISYSDSGSDATNVLRIYPTSPLKGATRYLVVVTDGIKDGSGKNVSPASWFTTVSNGFVPVEGAAGGLGGAIKNWLSLASGYFGVAPTVAGGAFADPAISALTAKNVVYTTTFTTGGTTEVLSAMAAPHLALGTDAIAQELLAKFRYTLEEQLVAGADDVTAVTAVITAGAVATPPVTISQLEAGKALLLARHLPQPAPRVATFDNTLSNLGQDLINAAAGLEAATVLSADEKAAVDATGAGINAVSTTIALANGSIKLPYYLSAPEGGAADPTLLTQTAPRAIASMWKADDSLGTDFSALLGAIGLAASDVTPPSTNVTRHFPLAKAGDHAGTSNPIGYVDVPVSVIYDTACAGTHKPVIYQHGITSTRTPAIGFATQLMARSGDNCYATVAIDLPMHGWTPNNGLEKTLLVLNHGSKAVDANVPLNIASGTFSQRHFGLTSDGGSPAAMFNANGTVKDIAGSGSLYINILNFQNTRDNNRQAVMDLMNLNASLAFMSFKGDDAIADFDLTSGVSFAGHSLGAITGTTFLAVNNALAPNTVTNLPATKTSGYLNLVNAGVIANGGGQLTKLIENSPAFSPAVLAGFETLGTRAGLDLSQGSKLLETALAVFQGTVDSGDPINFGSMLKATAPLSGVLAFEVVGNGNDATGPLGNTNPADTAVPNYTSPPLVAYDAESSNDEFIDTAASPLGGSQPMHSQIGLTQIDATVAAGAAPLRHVVRFTDGTHGSFGSPSDKDPTTNNGHVNAEMMHQSAQFISENGKGVTIGSGSVSGSAFIQGVAP